MGPVGRGIHSPVLPTNAVMGLLWRGQAAWHGATASSSLLRAAWREERAGKSHLRAPLGRREVEITQEHPVCSSAEGVSV